MTAHSTSPYGFYQMGVPPVRVDILMSISGLTFDAAWPRRIKADFADVPVLFINREDLIASKLAAGGRKT